MTVHLGWFSTGRGKGSYGMLQRMLTAIDGGDVDARIEFVFSNRERGEEEGSDHFFDLVDAHGIPLVTHSLRRFREAHSGPLDRHRGEYDARILELLAPYSPDLCILAGYLLVLSPELCHAFTHVNLHPALPGGPKGLWQSVIWELIDQRAPDTGAMMFLATEEVDEGPPIAFTRVPLRGPAFDGLWAQVGDAPAAVLREQHGEEHPLFQAIRQEGVRREPVLVLETVKAYARGEWQVQAESLVDGSGRPILPRDLTEQVEAALATQ